MSFGIKGGGGWCLVFEREWECEIIWEFLGCGVGTFIEQLLCMGSHHQQIGTSKPIPMVVMGSYDPIDPMVAPPLEVVKRVYYSGCGPSFSHTWHPSSKLQGCLSSQWN
ncbi:Hypothetical predicted protein [Prunus dulcis]|uniref:Uncharacterized protein n=1 Tax=Prunus dulcis TaxID=3755 RepID=A0A5E4FNV6_PRUDU|nr:Hypothetical predicted protein [Prunus dulcis]